MNVVEAYALIILLDLSSSAISLQIHLKANYNKASCLTRKLMVSAGYVGDDEATAATLD